MFRRVAIAVVLVLAACGGLQSQEGQLRQTLEKSYDNVQVTVVTEKVGKSKHKVVKEYDAEANVPGYTCRVTFEQKPGEEAYKLDEVNGQDVPDTDRKDLDDSPAVSVVQFYLGQNLRHYNCAVATGK